ncbi:reverse transcriptase [Elysia marginata]|uniref:Reverse transcriptase n=1 Tax=Elysia marginata TaxID=1093978 RepID=A0AAV4FLS9_9GAST|nr:reverse transcriptase [Elysia marginata]
MQGSTFTRAIYLEAQQGASKTCASYKHCKTTVQPTFAKLHFSQYLQQRAGLRNGVGGRTQQVLKEKDCWTAAMIGKCQQICQNGINNVEVIRRTTLRPDIVSHAPSLQQFIMVEQTVPCESRVEQAHTYK